MTPRSPDSTGAPVLLFLRATRTRSPRRQLDFPGSRINQPGVSNPRPLLRRLGRGRDNDMRFMVLVKASKESEAGQMPDKEILTKMGAFNDELVKAGV